MCPPPTLSHWVATGCTRPRIPLPCSAANTDACIQGDGAVESPQEVPRRFPGHFHKPITRQTTRKPPGAGRPARTPSWSCRTLGLSGGARSTLQRSNWQLYVSSSARCWLQGTCPCPCPGPTRIPPSRAKETLPRIRGLRWPRVPGSPLRTHDRSRKAACCSNLDDSLYQ